MDRRNTIQRELVYQAVNTLRCHATAEEIYTMIIKDHPSVGKGTVYRNLSVLAEEGKIYKVETPGGPDHFDHNVTKHYHIKCLECGRVFDVDMDLIENLEDRIRDKHGMKILDNDILFKGICRECREAGK